MPKRAFSPKCSKCRKRTMALSAIPYSITINHDGREYAVEIPSLVVPKCTACGNFVLDDEANEQIDRAFRHKARLLTPEQIREGRERLGLTQQALADRLGIAVSTLSRWETGGQIQQRSLNRAMKAYIRSAEIRRCYAWIESEETGEWLPPPMEDQAATVGTPLFNPPSRLVRSQIASDAAAVTEMNAPSQISSSAAMTPPRMENITRSLTLRHRGG